MLTREDNTLSLSLPCAQISSFYVLAQGTHGLSVEVKEFVVSPPLTKVISN